MEKELNSKKNKQFNAAVKSLCHENHCSVEKEEIMTLSELLVYTTLQMYTFRKVLGKDKFKEFMNYMNFKFNQDEFEKNYHPELAKKPTLIQYRKFGQFMCM